MRVPLPESPLPALTAPPAPPLSSQEDFTEALVLPLREMPHDGVGQAYTVLERPPGSMALGRFATVLRFRVREIDPSTGEAEEGGYGDEYQLEDVEVGASDYIKPAYTPNFRAAWDALPEESEMVRGVLGCGVWGWAAWAGGALGALWCWRGCEAVGAWTSLDVC